MIFDSNVLDVRISRKNIKSLNLSFSWNQLYLFGNDQHFTISNLKTVKSLFWKSHIVQIERYFQKFLFWDIPELSKENVVLSSQDFLDRNWKKNNHSYSKIMRSIWSQAWKIIFERSISKVFSQRNVTIEVVGLRSKAWFFGLSHIDGIQLYCLALK